MREIKFRAWTRNRMIEYEEILKDNHNPLHEHNLEWMQFTGLKDKNGKDIYESDLLKSLPNGIEPREIWEVFWINNGWWMKTKAQFSDKEIIIPIDMTMKIIGNIYQNPEILKP